MARCRNRDEYISGAAETEDLALEQPVVAVVIADRRENRGIGGERERGSGSTIIIEPRQHLPGEVLGVRRTTAIAGEKQLASVPDGDRCNLDDVPDDGHECRIVDCRLDRIARSNQVIQDRRQRSTCHVSHPRSANLTGPAIPPVALSASSSPRRSSGRTRNIKKPPPPAPETFPASAPLATATS